MIILRYYHHYGSRGTWKDVSPTVFFLCFFTPFILAGLYYLYYYCRIHELHLLKIFQYGKPLSAERIQILKTNIPYYNTLPASDKKIFQTRVQHFLINKKCVSPFDMPVTEEMKVMIAAACVQIMFGLDSYYLAYFEKISIRYSGVLNTEELKSSKQISIPWKEFKEGYRSSDDGYNPGLKIMALALSLEHRLNTHSKSMFNSVTFKTFNQLYKHQAERYIQSGKSTYNSYSEVDRSEYFAVAVEYFFERPHDFKEKQPEMYMAMSKLLRQDPTGYLRYKRK